MKLLNGDCLELLKDIEPKSVDLVFCDLPYGQTFCDWDNKIDLTKLWVEFKRIAKPNTPFFFTCTTKFGYELIKSNEKWFRYDLVWEKSSPCCFLSAKKMPMRKHEMIYVFYEKLPLYDISSHQHKFVLFRDAYSAGESHLYGNSKCSERHKYDPPLPTSILTVNSERGKHRTQKPTELMKWVLKYYSKEEDVILDPTMGSGSMGVACKDMNRQFIGIEIDKDIYKVACERLLE